MIRLAPLLVGAVVLAACAGATEVHSSEIRGVVLEVEGDLTSVSSFLLRTDGGEVLTVIPAEDGDFEFPISHLSDHRSTLAPIIVELDRSVDPPLALAIRDADESDQHE